MYRILKILSFISLLSMIKKEINMDRIGIIDIGSNSMRVVLIEITGERSYEVLDEMKFTVRLGRDMKDGALAEARIKAAVDSLKEFKRLCDSYKVDEIIAVATEAVRKSTNQEEFLTKAKDEAGIDVKVLSGTKEAYYGYLGTINSMDISSAVLMDIGGSSTELTWVEDRKIKESISLPIGAIVVADKFRLIESFDEKVQESLKEFLVTLFNEVHWLKKVKNIPLVGIGGTYRTIGKIHKRKFNYPISHLHNYEIKPNEIIDIFEELKNKDVVQRSKIKGLPKERADIFPGSCAEVATIVQQFKFKKIYISTNGLRQGLLYERLLGEDKALIDDILEFSINNLTVNYNLKREHSKHVCELSMNLYSELFPLMGVSGNADKILKAAALLHDCGVRIGYYNRDEYSFSIIKDTNIDGLTHKEQLMAAYVTLLEGKKIKGEMKYYEEIVNKDDIDTIEKLSLILALAEALDRGIDSNVIKVSCNIEVKEVTLKISSKVVPSLETRAVAEYSEEFEKIFNRKLKVK